MKRLFRHLLLGSWSVRRRFPSASMRAIEAAIHGAEATHTGEIRFAVEAALDWMPLLQGQSVRERALEVFSQSRVWDTAQNNGVLIYLLLAEHDVEIVADRGINALVGHECWEMICRRMETLLREGRFEQGVITGVQAVGNELQCYFPQHGEDDNELPDAPVIVE